jgi:hypothetical protein
METGPTTPEKTIPITPKQELLNLQKEQTIGGSGWTNEKRQRLLDLQNIKPDSQFTLTKAHEDALNRQKLAGTSGNPNLTEEERRLIQEANKMRE